MDFAGEDFAIESTQVSDPLSQDLPDDTPSQDLPDDIPATDSSASPGVVTTVQRSAKEKEVLSPDIALLRRLCNDAPPRVLVPRPPLPSSSSSSAKPPKAPSGGKIPTKLTRKLRKATKMGNRLAALVRKPTRPKPVPATKKTRSPTSNRFESLADEGEH